MSAPRGCLTRSRAGHVFFQAPSDQAASPQRLGHGNPRCVCHKTGGCRECAPPSAPDQTEQSKRKVRAGVAGLPKLRTSLKEQL